MNLVMFLSCILAGIHSMYMALLHLLTFHSFKAVANTHSYDPYLLTRLYKEIK